MENIQSQYLDSYKSQQTDLTLNLKEKIHLHTIGIHTCRYNIFEIIDDNYIVYPCGVFLLKFSLKENKVINRLRLGHSVISSMKRCFYYLITALYNGEACIIDIDSFKVVSKFKLEHMQEISHLSISSDMKYICITSDYYLDEGKVINGAVSILEKLDKVDKRDLLEYKQIKFFKFRESLCEFYTNDENQEKLVIFEKNLIEGMPPKSSNYFYIIRELDVLTDFNISREILLDHYDEISTIRKYENFVVLQFSRRVFKIFDLKSFHLLSNITFEGAGCIGAFDFMDYNLFVTNISRNLIKIDLSDLIKNYNNKQINIKNTESLPPRPEEIFIPKNLQSIKTIQYPNLQILIKDEDHIKQLNYLIRIDEKMNKIFWANEHGLFGYDLESKKYILNLHSLIKSSGCGVTINKDSNLIAVGDLERNITIFNNIWDQLSFQYNTCHHLSEEDLIFLRLEAKDPIRSVHWDEKLNSLFVGTMGGKIYLYEKNEVASDCKLLIDLHSTITCIRVFHLENIDYPILSVSTTGGVLYLFKINLNPFYELIILNSFEAHSSQPGNEDLRFGSLKIKAEIWSLTSYPGTKLNPEKNSLHIITSSEDQTVKIWEFSYPIELSTPKLIHCFKNHDLAVTSVDWKPMKVLSGEVLASCSDDKTIQIYDPLNNFQLVKTMKTDCIYDWHTITYISLEEDGAHLAVSTQNGFVVIYSLVTWEVVFCEKIHLGGVEGLCWKGDMLVSCASDLNIGVFKFCNK
jgi:WD40 repeat protein